MITFKKYVRGRCTLSGSVKNSTRTNVSWDVVKQRLKLSPQDLETIDSFVTNLKSDANENGKDKLRLVIGDVCVRVVLI